MIFWNHIFEFELPKFLWLELWQTSERCPHFPDDFLAGIDDSALGVDPFKFYWIVNLLSPI